MKTVGEHDNKEFLYGNYSVKKYSDFHLYYSTMLMFLKDEESLLVYVFYEITLIK